MECVIMKETMAATRETRAKSSTASKDLSIPNRGSFGIGRPGGISPTMSTSKVPLKSPEGGGGGGGRGVTKRKASSSSSLHPT